MHIAHILDVPEAGDILKIVNNLVGGLSKKGVRSTVVCLRDPRVSKPCGLVPGPDVVDLAKPVRFSWKFVFELSRLLRQRNVRLIQAHTPAAGIYGTWAAFFAGRPAIMSFHAFDPRPLPWVLRHLARRCVAASEHVREGLILKGRVSGKKIAVVYDGVDPQPPCSPRDKSRLRRELGLNEQRFTIGNIGPLVKNEDHATLIKAFRNLSRKDLDAQLVIAGQGPLENDLRGLANTFGLEERVRIITSDDMNKLELLKALDVFILTCFDKSRPVTLLEAQACGVPVIATNITAHPEVIEERKTGYLVPCGFPERIVSAVMRLNAIETLAAEMGEAAREHVIENFSLEKTVGSYIMIYGQFRKELRAKSSIRHSS